ncbi:hypothetical protein BJY52DRAFT_426005 [Lactarius psammicola]|nr:hypothetical protein BJY52DRAFT_426005 [Lactarius psammicola]
MTYTNVWKTHNTILLKDLQGTIEAASCIGPMIQGEVRIWKRGTTHSPLELTEWTDVLDQALRYPDVDWLIRTETSPSEAIAIEFTWECCTLVPHIPFQGAAPLSSDSLEPSSPARMPPASPSDSLMASNDPDVHTQFRTRAKDMFWRSKGRVATPVPPLASVTSSQSYDLPDASVADASYTEGGARYPLRKPSRPSKVTDSPSLDLENPHASALTSRRSFESTHSGVSIAPPLAALAHSPLERLALSIEDLISATGGTLTPDANEILTSWPNLERHLIQADIPEDPTCRLGRRGTRFWVSDELLTQPARQLSRYLRCI